MKTADGYIFLDGRLVRGHAVQTDDGIELIEGPYNRTPDVKGVIVPRMVNTHTHCADAGVKVEPGMSLEELVAPPNGLKHRYLRSASRETLVNDIRQYERNTIANGISHFIDFREGGAEGCRIAKEASDAGIILGRPISPEYDPEEIDEILSIADGIALSSISDIDLRYAEKVAEHAHRAGKPFAIHCSERIREDIDAVLSLEPAFLVHMCQASKYDLRKCADLDIPISVCPRSNRFFGKVPPLALMQDCNNTVAIGTDNAMLCSPDLRPEAQLFNTIIQDPGWTWTCLINGGCKLLNRTLGINSRNNMEEGFAVLPFEGNDPDSAWTSKEPVLPI